MKVLGVSSGPGGEVGVGGRWWRMERKGKRVNPAINLDCPKYFKAFLKG